MVAGGCAYGGGAVRGRLSGASAPPLYGVGGREPVIAWDWGGMGFGCGLWLWLWFFFWYPRG